MEQTLDQFQPLIPHTKLLNNVLSVQFIDENKDKVWDSIEKELKHLEEFCNNKYSWIGTRMWSLIRELATQQSDIESPEKTAIELVESIDYLSNLIGKNFQFYVDLKKEFDRACGNKDGSLEFANYLIENYKFCNMLFGDFVCMLSDVFATIRKMKSLPTLEDVRPISSGKVKSQKFFVKLEDVTKLKLATLKHYPLLRNGIKQGVNLVQDKQGRRNTSFERHDNKYSNEGEGDIREISSIYFDNKKLTLFHDMMLRVDGATQLRTRWEGESAPACMLEQKTKSFVLHDYTKQSINLQFNDVKNFITGKLNIKDKKISKSEIAFAKSLQRSIIKRQLRPMVRAQYQRATFQYENEPRLVLSLDCGIEYFREIYDEDGKAWCRDISNDVSREDGFIFPMAVLDVKSSVVLPEWLKSILSSSLVISAYGFNKFSHGVAKFYGTQARVLPSWFNRRAVHLPGVPWKQWFLQSSQDEVNILSDDMIKITHMAMKKKKESVSVIRLEEQNNQPLLSPKEPVPAPIFEPTQTRPKGFFQNVKALVFHDDEDEHATGLIQPKTFMANERTLTQWLNTSILLAFGSIAFLAYATNVPKFVGLAALTFSIMVSIYSLGIYHYRRIISKSKTKDGYYDDLLGPTILTIMIIIYLIAAVALSLSFPIYKIPQNNPLFEPGPVVSRDFRLVISKDTLNSGLPMNVIVSNIEQQLRNQIPKAYGGQLTMKGSMGLSFWDTLSSCSLKDNGYRLREIVGLDPSGTVTSVNTKLEYRSYDSRFATRMVEESFYSYFYASEYVNPPYKIQYAREVNSTASMSSYLHLAALANEFPEVFLWSIVDHLNGGESLVKVNNLDLKLDSYGSIQFPLGSRMAEMDVQIWYQSTNVFHGELSFSVFVESGDLVSRSDLDEIRKYYNQLQTLNIFNVTANDITNEIYNFNTFCS